MAQKVVELNVIPVRTADIKLNEENQVQLRSFTPHEYDRLYDDIKRHGVKDAIDLNEQMEIVEGYHRFEISTKLGFEYIPAVIRHFSSREEEKQHIHSVNVSRRHLNDFEIAEYGYDTVVEEREEAATRQFTLADSRPSQEAQTNPTLGSNDPKVEQPYIEQREKKGTAIQKAAKRIGLTEPTLKRAIKIIENAPEETKEKLRDGTTRISKEYNKIISREKRKKLLDEAKDKPVSQTVRLYNGDFRNVTIENKSIDLIFTDPPYDKESLPLYKDLGDLATRVLKPGGSLICYIGGYSLPEIIDYLREAGLSYNWFCYMKHTGPTKCMHGNHVICEGKLLLWFYKWNKLRDTGKYVGDFIKSGEYDKSLHEWAQSTVEAEHFINHVTFENDTVLDPFLGSGTTGIAALKLNRHFIGIEIDKGHFETAKSNVALFRSKMMGAQGEKEAGV